MRKPFLTVMGAAILSATLAGCGTTPYDLMVSDREHAEAEQACTGAGFKPGTNQFNNCLQDHDLARMHPPQSDSVSPR